MDGTKLERINRLMKDINATISLLESRYYDLEELVCELNDEYNDNHTSVREDW